MHSIKVLLTRSACVLAALATCGWVAPEALAAQANGKDKAQTVRKAPPSAATKKPAPRKAGKAAKKRAPVAKKAGPRKPRAATAARKKPPVTARSTSRKAPPGLARTRPTVPPPVAWTLPPLGPERFYPNGIPELRPEFLHPVPDASGRNEQAAAGPSAGMEPNWLP
jgi:hypothetical protein